MSDFGGDDGYDAGAGGYDEYGPDLNLCVPQERVWKSSFRLS